VRTAAWCGVVLGAASILGGCTQHLGVQGKVIAGEIAFIGAVDQKDPRLTGPGLEGATVSARGSGGTGSVATATSNPKGDFTLNITDEKALLSSVEFWGHKAGYVDARGRMPVPGADRKLLVILPGGPAGAPGGR
jgi:hypothetical protein